VKRLIGNVGHYPHPSSIPIREREKEKGHRWLYINGLCKSQKGLSFSAGLLDIGFIDFCGVGIFFF